MRKSRSLLTLLPALLLLGAAQQPRTSGPWRYFSPAHVAAERELETALLSMPSASSLAAFHELVSSRPHVAGSPGDARVVERLVEAYRRLGMAVEKQDLWLYLSRPVAAELEILYPRPEKLSLKEAVLPHDPYSRDPALTFGWNAYSGNGDVRAPAVYANYGRLADFEELEKLGLDVRGKIVIARYGGNFRGYKEKFAEQAGAAGLIIYSDPRDSGYARGLMYPEGGWSNASYIQRGSLATLSYEGDPLTPFVVATRDAKRLDPAEVNLPHIPVQPIGWGAAKRILSRMSGPPVPDGWQGALPFNYHLGGVGGPELHLVVKQKRELTHCANVVATLRGSRFPDQKVIVGSHDDAWSFGAGDPNSGTIVVYEVAKSFAALAQRGLRPARSLVFANWTAEEFGLEGSSEWVEAHRDDLVGHTVAYINLDAAAMGLAFGAESSPSLKPVIADAAAAVPQPGGRAGESVLDAWMSRDHCRSPDGLPRFANLGGGSDHVGFYCYVGVPAAGLGGRGAAGTAYHSNYDDLAWYRKVVGSHYRSARMVSQLVNVLVARLAGSDLLPLAPRFYGGDFAHHLADLAKRSARLGFTADFGDLASRAKGVEERATRVENDLQEALASGVLEGAALERVNRQLADLEQAWISPRGLPGRPWYRNLFAAPDDNSGYAPWMLPGLRWAVERKSADDLKAMVARYDQAFDDLDARLERIESEIPGNEGRS